ncbi:MAG TPA: bifunctional isocitrate dehydrogenase kinase/phosphatase [Anaeromyxobacteraceae bacterium]|nr:bifunctional isocitrate dehydrogenase kinase/phosphatase [Anaeromyxobacteraceae bacterium]
MVRIDPDRELALWAASAILGALDAYQEAFRAVTARARQRFATRDWKGAHEDAMERLDLRDRHIGRIVGELRELLGASIEDRRLWGRMKAIFMGLAARRPDVEVAETFYNSVTRRVFSTVGVDPRIEFAASEIGAPLPDPGRPGFKTFRPRGSTAELMAALLADLDLGAPWRDLAGDARRAAEAVDRQLGGGPLAAVEVLPSVFYRGKGAYAVARLRLGTLDAPLILALLHEEGGVRLDAVLTTPQDASVVFSFTRTYFHVLMERPRAVVDFLKSILPQKRLSELYIAVGEHKHGKTELYRELLQHLRGGRERFERARGDRGLVMAVFTLPSLDIVFKVIRDRFAYPKTITREEVQSKYRLVFRHDRAGRLVDAQEFEHLAFPRERFAADLLEELLGECADTVALNGDAVDVKHLYAERRVMPLNLYLREMDPQSARSAVLDFGQSIRDLAATNTFPGDMLLKNFGVTRTGRVIFYDYDELTLVTKVNFRDLPRARDGDEEMASEPWFYVGEDDVFPEEFLPFLGLPDGLREAFLEAHAELLHPAFWRRMQERHRAGEIVDIFPYHQRHRLPAWPSPEQEARP